MSSVLTPSPLRVERHRLAAFLTAIAMVPALAACASTPTTESGESTAVVVEDSGAHTPDDPLYAAQRWLEARQEAGEVPGHHEVVRVFALDDDRVEVIISPFNEPPATDATRLVLARDQEGWEVVEEGTLRARRDWPRY
ncbi:hypothetical protein FRC98_14140 [Lujinxingia vulgaris]|uniref:Uncharacterized protein n=1 Tax=Lujinxingia vulgaris TaxID=2600176 RepID=A0A5C6X1W7_9DELT|nr:hypothetical protein [Lujinxingia vulgaris]TXD35812.1 hypothetical protein FRC98_14140 [Lujinxingia vulgaris]